MMGIRIPIRGVSGRDLYRTIVKAVAQPECLRILLEPGDGASDVRAEVTEVFCGAYPEWSRRMVEGGVVELWKQAATAPRSKPLEKHCDHSGIGLPGCIVCDPRTVSQGGPQPEPGKRNPAKRVISLAIFGDCRAASEHWRRMPAYLACWVRAHHALFPGYELRIHHDDWIYQTGYGDVLHGLLRRGLVKLVRVASDGVAGGKTRAMLWRLLPLWDPEVSHVFCRDVDSLPTWRDRLVCEEFVKSGLSIGVVHDDPMHAGMMGGLCHFAAAPVLRTLHLTGLDDLVAQSEALIPDLDWHRHGTDQNALNRLVAASGEHVLEHSLFTTLGENGQRSARTEPTIAGAELRTHLLDAAPPVQDSVASVVREKSDALTNYLGAAGFDTERALSFYNAYSPVAEAVREAESEAGGSL